LARLSHFALDRREDVQRNDTEPDTVPSAGGGGSYERGAS
jgi:hypothetical protein